jgi:hypothetical protein
MVKGIILIFFFLSPSLLACPVSHWYLGDDYPSHYRFQILPDDPIRSSVEEADFLEVTQAVYQTYRQDFLKQETQVDINQDWKKPYFTAFAKKEGEKHFSISFWGGFARIPGMTKDALALVACHEIGHFWGGKPTIQIDDLSWSSTEGQSDYFATGSCLKRYLRQTTKYKDHQQIQTDPTAYTLCRIQYPDDLDFSVCLKSTKAAESFGKVLNYLSESDLHLNILTPSPQVVRQTLYNSYPSQQCRLDTLVNGSLCPEDKYPCQIGLGQRPACWYAYR